MKHIDSITSLQNPTLKRILNLKEDSKERRLRKLFVVEGFREISRAFAASFVVNEILFCREFLDQDGEKLLSSLNQSDARFYELSPTCFNKLVVRKESCGIVVVFSTPTAEPTLFPTGLPLILLLEGIEKPGNLGAILRTADACGVQAIILVDSKVDLFNPNVIRSSLGCCFTVPVFSMQSQEALDFCSRHSYEIFAAAISEKSSSLFEQNFSGKKIALLLGSESHGISNFWHQHAPNFLCIPMQGTTDSLNVSVASSVILYEIYRQNLTGMEKKR